MVCRLQLRIETKDLPVPLHVRLAGREIIESDSCCFNDVAGDKCGVFPPSLLWTLNATFPFQHGPVVIADISEQREDLLEADLTVTERTQRAGPSRPRLVSAVNDDAAQRMELGTLGVESTNPLAVQLDELQVVELL